MRRTLLLIAAALSAAEPQLPAFFTGCWEIRTPSIVIEEQWMKPAGGMIGMSRTVKNGKTVGIEFMKLEAKDGGVYLIPTNEGGTTPFKAVKLTATEAVFENPKHDFPQRILYRSENGGLFARIEDMSGKRGQDFPYKRVSCP